MAADGPGQHHLLIRRNRRTGEYAFYRTWTPRPVPLRRLVAVASRHWAIEEGFQTGKELTALDRHQVRTWISWHRWTTLALLAHAFLAVTAATSRADPHGDEVDLIPLTRNEIGRLFTALARTVARGNVISGHRCLARHVVQNLRRTERNDQVARRQAHLMIRVRRDVTSGFFSARMATPA